MCGLIFIYSWIPVFWSLLNFSSIPLWSCKMLGIILIYLNLLRIICNLAWRLFHVCLKNAYFSVVRISTMSRIKIHYYQPLAFSMSPVWEEKPLIGDNVETQLSQTPTDSTLPPDSLANPKISRDMCDSLSMTLWVFLTYFIPFSVTEGIHGIFWHQKVLERQRCDDINVNQWLCPYFSGAVTHLQVGMPSSI